MKTKTGPDQIDFSAFLVRSDEQKKARFFLRKMGFLGPKLIFARFFFKDLFFSPKFSLFFVWRFMQLKSTKSPFDVFFLMFSEYYARFFF